MRRHRPRQPTDDISGVVEDYLSGDLADEDVFNFGIQASLQGRIINVKLTFLAGERYCCSQPACHLELDENDGWERLRELLDENGIELTKPSVFKCEMAIRDGASFDGTCGNLSDPGDHGGRWVFEEDRV